MEIIITLSTLIIGLIFGILVANPVKKWMKERDLIKKITRNPKYVFRIVHLNKAEDDHSMDFSTKIKEQNALQGLFRFEVENVKILTHEEYSELRGLMSKKDFIEAIASILSYTLVNRHPNIKDKKTRKIVLTNVPIPGNFYGWNSMDRTLLVISIAPILKLFPVEERPNLDDFIIRMLQRMATFSVVPSLNPKRTHIEVCRGCLFDFTVELKRVVDVVRIPFICSDCWKLIERDQGAKFVAELKNWIEAAPYFGSISNKD